MKEEIENALTDIRGCFQAYYKMGNVPELDNSLKVIEKELIQAEEMQRTLEIIVKKEVDIPLLTSIKKFRGDNTLCVYNAQVVIWRELTQAEFDLVKKVVKKYGKKRFN